jgi:hypothetical protein
MLVEVTGRRSAKLTSFTMVSTVTCEILCRPSNLTSLTTFEKAKL